jgi:hypothetical protein
MDIEETQKKAQLLAGGSMVRSAEGGGGCEMEISGRERVLYS